MIIEIIPSSKIRFFWALCLFKGFYRCFLSCIPVIFKELYSRFLLKLSLDKGQKYFPKMKVCREKQVIYFMSFMYIC